jgi:hypothetical protein
MSQRLKPLEHLPLDACRFAMRRARLPETETHPAEERWVFCGEPVVPGKSYCLTHCMACRQTLAVARRQSEFLRPQQAEAVRKYLAKAG